MFLTAYCSDTDCDGTTFCAIRVDCDTDPRLRAYDVERIVPESEFVQSREYHALDAFSQNHYRRHGYVSLGARWNPWAGPEGDDSIGIPAFYPEDETLVGLGDFDGS